MAKYTVSVVLLEKKFLTFTEASNYVEQILQQSPDAVVSVDNDRSV
jgi:hypothetical protein